MHLERRKTKGVSVSSSPKMAKQYFVSNCFDEAGQAKYVKESAIDNFTEYL